MLSAFGELKPISRIDRDDIGCEGTGFVGIGRVMQVMMVTMVILVVIMVIMLTVMMMIFIVMMMMLVARELDLEGLGGLCRLVGEDWLDDNDDDMMMWAGIETVVVIKF